MKLRCQPALKFVAALVLAAVSAPLCAGRQSTGQRIPRPDSTQRELQRTLERDLLFREMQEMAARGPNAKPSPRQQLVAQINEDFARIQVVNNALAQAAASGEELDFKLVAQAATEIRKRAERLKNSLLLPKSDEHRPRVADEIEPGQLKASLAALDRLVISFVSNPGFQSVKVIDSRWPLQARHDLEEIIELCGRVRKSSEQRHKTARKSH